MSELSVRETAARALRDNLRDTVGDCVCDKAYTSRGLVDPDCGWHLAEGTTDDDSVTRVLAAVADHDGLADVLADALMQPVHAPLNQHDPETGDCVSCPWPVHALPVPDVAAHLVDVIRARLRGES